MSTLLVEVCKIQNVQSHPNADRLDLVGVKGWTCVVQKGRFRVGDKCVYIPIDSILPSTLEEKIFGEGSKVKLSGGRVKTIKLRGAISQGLVLSLEDVGLPNYFKEGVDVSRALGITKYEPPVSVKLNTTPFMTSKKQLNPHFRKYTDIENFKHYPTIFQLTDFVVVTEKIHGTNFRCGWVPFHAYTTWRKIKQYFGLAPKYEFVFGSHNVQLQDQLLHKGYYDSERLRKNRSEIQSQGEA